jgi:hypothetical protein
MPLRPPGAGGEQAGAIRAECPQCLRVAGVRALAPEHRGGGADGAGQKWRPLGQPAEDVLLGLYAGERTFGAPQAGSAAAFIPEGRQPRRLEIPGRYDHPPSAKGDIPGASAGMTASDVNERFDTAIYLPPGKLPASRATILDYMRDTGAPDYAITAASLLPADQQFATIGEIVRAIGIPTEAGRDAGSQSGG